MSVLLEIDGFDELPDDAEGPICEHLAAEVLDHTGEWPANINILEEYQDDRWERGDPCPECGSEKFSVITPEGNVWYASEGEFHYGKKDNALGIGPIDIICAKCMEQLYQTPAAALIQGWYEDDSEDD